MSGTVDGGRSLVQDTFRGGQTLPDQSGAGAVLTFTFTKHVDLIWVRCVGGDGRADPFGSTPTASQGIPCIDDEPNPITIHAKAIKVFAGVGTTVSVWGFSYEVNS